MLSHKPKKALCKVWEITDPSSYWHETFVVNEIADIDAIFMAFNSTLWPDETARAYEFISFID